jgi:Methyltransferase domain
MLVAANQRKFSRQVEGRLLSRFRTFLTSVPNGLLGLFNLRLIRTSSFPIRTTEQQQRRQLTAIDDYLLDLLQLSVGQVKLDSLVKLRIVTDHPLAFQSPDHINPCGARNDNTRHPRFVAKCSGVFGKSIFHLDLGCAGGGLVWDFCMGGHQSYGVEGSDYPLVNRRALWRVIPANLFTADITKPFHFLDEGESRRRFDLITAWEVLEHLPRESLLGFFENLQTNLDDEGLFVASVATFHDAMWHATVEPRQWWIQRFEEAGFKPVEGIFDPADYVRGSGNPRADDWEEAKDPSRGFHLVVRKRRASSESGPSSL